MENPIVGKKLPLPTPHLFVRFPPYEETPEFRAECRRLREEHEAAWAAWRTLHNIPHCDPTGSKYRKG